MSDKGEHDVSSADVMLFKNNLGPDPPSSEVGYESAAAIPIPTETVSTQPTLSTNMTSATEIAAAAKNVHESASSAASANVNIPADFLLQMMQTMKEMTERLSTPPQSEKVKINDVFLPSFDPDANVGVRE